MTSEVGRIEPMMVPFTLDHPSVPDKEIALALQETLGRNVYFEGPHFYLLGEGEGDPPKQLVACRVEPDRLTIHQDHVAICKEKMGKRVGIRQVEG